MSSQDTKKSSKDKKPSPNWRTRFFTRLKANTKAYLKARAEAYRQSESPILIGSVCGDCLKPIHKHDDEAEICIDCGGRNRRIR